MDYATYKKWTNNLNMILQLQLDYAKVHKEDNHVI